MQTLVKRAASLSIIGKPWWLQGVSPKLRLLWEHPAAETLPVFSQRHAVTNRSFGIARTSVVTPKWRIAFLGQTLVCTKHFLVVTVLTTYRPECTWDEVATRTKVSFSKAQLSLVPIWDLGAEEKLVRQVRVQPTTFFNLLHRWLGNSK